MKKLGRLERVPLRDIWPDEARDFTPWLAEADNIAKLGAAIGFELEVLHVEKAVGPFSADILARDIGSDLNVVIENQLAKTDHDHLGKALTYSAALNARTIVWIAPRFTEEHKKAVDWLNENTIDDLGFYAVEVELWSIDGSPPAVRFNVVSRPSELLRQAVTQGRGDLTPNRQLQLEWWTAFVERLSAAGVLPSVRPARAQSWYDVTLGRSGFVLSNIAYVEGTPRIACRLYLKARAGGAQALQLLLRDRVAIEKELGASLIWDPYPENIDKTVVLERHADIAEREKWPELLGWLLDATVRMRKVFAPRIKALELPRANGEE